MRAGLHGRIRQTETISAGLDLVLSSYGLHTLVSSGICISLLVRVRRNMIYMKGYI